MEVKEMKETHKQKLKQLQHLKETLLKSEAWHNITINDKEDSFSISLNQRFLFNIIKPSIRRPWQLLQNRRR